MFVATTGDINHVFTGADIQPQVADDHQSVSEFDLRCPLCDVPVGARSTDQPLKCFFHKDGTPDCFHSDGASDEHRLGVEVSAKALHNRIYEVTGESVEIDIERRIGSRSQFVITDVMVTYPIRVAAEIYYRPGKLALGRRLRTMFNYDCRTYLIFHTGGQHNINRIEQHLQKVAPLCVGRFNPESLEVSLGDLFTEQQINFSQKVRNQLPNYIAL
jgi:hypothetical protein